MVEGTNNSDHLVIESAAYARGKQEGRLEAQEEVKWIIAALCMRDPKRRVRIAWRDVLAVPAKARLEKFEDTTGQAVVYRLREEE